MWSPIWRWLFIDKVPNSLHVPKLRALLVIVIGREKGTLYNVVVRRFGKFDGALCFVRLLWLPNIVTLC